MSEKKDIPFKTEAETKAGSVQNVPEVATAEELLQHAERQLTSHLEQVGYWTGYKRRLMEESGSIPAPTKG